MTVKTISKKPIQDFTKKVICHSCGYQLSYAVDDIHSRHGKDISGGPDGEEWISCSQCGKRVILRSW